MARREERAYREYVSDEQRSQPGCPARELCDESLLRDTSVLLSAVIGGRAKLVLAHPDAEAVFTPTAAMDEVYEYLPVLARKKRLHLDALLLTLAALPLT